MVSSPSLAHRAPCIGYLASGTVCDSARCADQYVSGRRRVYARRKKRKRKEDYEVLEGSVLRCYAGRWQPVVDVCESEPDLEEGPVVIEEEAEL